MVTLTTKKTMNSAISYTDMSKKGLWTHFRNYLIENKQTFIAGMISMNGNPYYAYSKILNK